MRLDRTSYKVWLDNNAVGYVALDRARTQNYAEYTLVSKRRPGYLTELSRTTRWMLYRVIDPTPIVPGPQRLLSATQARMRVEVPCTCSFYVRVRYSKFLGATARAAGSTSTARLQGRRQRLDDRHHPGPRPLRLRRRLHPSAALTPRHRPFSPCCSPS